MRSLHQHSGRRCYSSWRSVFSKGIAEKVMLNDLVARPQHGANYTISRLSNYRIGKKEEEDVESTVWNWHIWQGINQDWAKCDNIHQCLYANTSEQTSLLILIWTHCCDELPRAAESKTAVLRLGQHYSSSSNGGGGGGYSHWHILAVCHCSLLAASFFELAALHGRLRKLHVLEPCQCTLICTSIKQSKLLIWS